MLREARQYLVCWLDFLRSKAWVLGFEKRSKSNKSGIFLYFGIIIIFLLFCICILTQEGGSASNMFYIITISIQLFIYIFIYLLVAI